MKRTKRAKFRGQIDRREQVTFFATYAALILVDQLTEVLVAGMKVGWCTSAAEDVLIADLVDNVTVGGRRRRLSLVRRMHINHGRWRRRHSNSMDRRRRLNQGLHGLGARRDKIGRKRIRRGRLVMTRAIIPSVRWRRKMPVLIGIMPEALRRRRRRRLPVHFHVFFFRWFPMVYGVGHTNAHDAKKCFS
jgi:hypothetical protein